MGEDLCKVCEHKCNEFNEKNLSQLEKKFERIEENSQSKEVSEKKLLIITSNKENKRPSKDYLINNNNINKNLYLEENQEEKNKKEKEDEEGKQRQQKIKEEEERIRKKQIEKDNFIMQLEEIHINYKARLITKYFRELKKKKEESHKEIVIMKNMQDKNFNLSSIINSNDTIDVDLFPEETYYFIGSFFNNKKDGFGFQYYPESNSYYYGYFINDKRVDWCKFEDKSRKYLYKGQTNNNLTGHYGICVNYYKQTVYEGEWLNNRKEGVGIEHYQDKSFYEGEFHDGLKEGSGRYIWCDGSIYEGGWVKNSLEGYGTYKFQDGSYCTGMWKDNKMNGFGKFTFPMVKCYIGFFKNDIKFGFGLIYWFTNQTAFIGYWKNNRQDGLGKYISKDKIRYGYWTEGRKTAEYDKKEFDNQLNTESIMIKNIFEYDYLSLGNFVQQFNDI